MKNRQKAGRLASDVWNDGAFWQEAEMIGN